MIARLGDVATYVNGYAFKPSDWSDIGLPIIRIQDLTGNSYQANRYNGEYDKRYEIHDGDVLISWSASLGVYVWTGEKAVLNQHIFKVVFNKLEVDKSFFVHQVRNILENSVSQAHGATMKHLTKPVFDALPFNLPSVAEQQRISSVLDKLTIIISYRKQQLAKLDELVKARFVEMFDTLTTTNYPIKTLDELCVFIKDGTHQTPKYTEDTVRGIKFLSSKDVTSGQIDWSKIKYIPQELHEELYSRIAPQRGDILLAKNGTTGIPAIVDTDEVFDIYVSLALLRFKPGNHVTYIWAALGTLETKKQFDSSLKGVGVPNLHLSEIKKTKIIIPPVELQNEFSVFVEKINRQKLTIQQSLDQLEVLRKSLMQEYFG